MFSREPHLDNVDQIRPLIQANLVRSEEDQMSRKQSAAESGSTARTIRGCHLCVHLFCFRRLCDWGSGFDCDG
jgi:hypothetical protein